MNELKLCRAIIFDELSAMFLYIYMVLIQCYAPVAIMKVDGSQADFGFIFYAFSLSFSNLERICAHIALNVLVGNTFVSILFTVFESF